MKNTEIYFKAWCPYSRRALRLLDAIGVDYTPIDVTDDTVREQEMRERAGRTSVPQIFIDGRHIGGYDDLAALDKSGELDRLLTGRPQIDRAA
jgi:glutaredoxin 3